jgi:hypothetical protein
MPCNVGKRRLLLQARAAGKSLADAAEVAGVSTRTAERWNADPTFQAELRERLADLDAEESLTLREYRRQVLQLAKAGLGQQVAVLTGGNVSPAVRSVVREIQAHLVRLYPAAVDLAVVDANPAEVPGSGAPCGRCSSCRTTHDAQVVTWPIGCTRGCAPGAMRTLRRSSSGQRYAASSRPPSRRRSCRTSRHGSAPAPEPPAPRSVAEVNEWLRRQMTEDGVVDITEATISEELKVMAREGAAPWLPSEQDREEARTRLRVRQLQGKTELTAEEERELTALLAYAAMREAMSS